jgi:hypothetical protein
MSNFGKKALLIDWTQEDYEYDLEDMEKNRVVHKEDSKSRSSEAYREDKKAKTSHRRERNGERFREI